jgi:hypothetical protein
MRAAVIWIATFGGAAAGVAAARRRYLRWGATGQESDQSVVGDDLLQNPDLVATRAITVRAAIGQVWPWLVQIGQGRAGFYSYDFLENLVGCDIHSSDSILPEHQGMQVADYVNLAPEVKLRVAAIDPGRAFVLRGGVPTGSGPPPYDFTWAFQLVELGGKTRLLVRERYSYARWWAGLLVEPVSFVMTQKMLRGIRDRAERTPTLEPSALSAQRSSV